MGLSLFSIWTAGCVKTKSPMRPMSQIQYKYSCLDNDFLFPPTIPMRTLYSPNADEESEPSEIKMPEDLLLRYLHVTVTWKNSIIFWGGRDANYVHFEPSVVAYHSSGKWFRKRTSGDVPQLSCLTTASVINDEMFVFGGSRDEVCIYSLDLNTWTWTKKIPRGAYPSCRSHCTSWVYKNKMYILDGSVEKMKVFCYNVCNNHWEWPQTKGNKPPKRYFTSTIINEDTVFLFGGINLVLDSLTLNSLYILDMESMSWKEVPETANSNNTPRARCWHSFNRISKSAAVLVGGRSDYDIIDDCWILDLKKASQAIDMSSIWTKVQNLDQDLFRRMAHTAVVEPVSQKIWLMAGRGKGNVKILAPSSVVYHHFGHAITSFLLQSPSPRSLPS